MKVLWTSNQLSFAAIGGFIGWFLGGCDGLLYALLAFVVIDYITGVMCAIENHDLSSEIGFSRHLPQGVNIPACGNSEHR